MAYKLGEPTVQQYFDANGDPLTLGTIEFYVYDTSNPTLIYSDSAGTSAGTSVTLNLIGAPVNGSGTPIALFFDDEVIYKIVRKDANGTAIGPTIGPYTVNQIIPCYGSIAGIGNATAETTTDITQRVITAGYTANGLYSGVTLDRANGRIRVDTAGTYRVTANLMCTGTASKTFNVFAFRTSDLVFGFVGYTFTFDASSTPVAVSLAAAVEVAANDNIELRQNTTNSGTSFTVLNCNLYIEKLVTTE